MEQKTSGTFIFTDSISTEPAIELSSAKLSDLSTSPQLNILFKEV